MTKLVSNEDLLNEIRSVRQLIEILIEKHQLVHDTISIKKAARIMKRSHKTVTDMCEDRVIPARKINYKNKKGYTFRLNLIDVIKFMEKDEPMLKKNFDGIKIIKETLNERRKK